MDKLLKIFKAEIKSINEKDFTLDAIVSTKKQDRDGDIIVPDAFSKRLKHYKDHPVLLSSHDYRDLTKQIGEALSVKVTEDGLEAKFKYYVGEGNPEADWAWVLAQKGIASYSIGFMGHEFEWIEEKDKDGVMHILGKKFIDVELLEISQVTVPSNRGALQMGLSIARESAELCELAIKSFDKGDLKDADVDKKLPGDDKDKGDDKEKVQERGSVDVPEGEVSGDKKTDKVKEHYSEKLLEQEQGAQTAQTEDNPIDAMAVKEAAGEIVSEMLKKESN